MEHRRFAVLPRQRNYGQFPKFYQLKIAVKGSAVGGNNAATGAPFISGTNLVGQVTAKKGTIGQRGQWRHAAASVQRLKATLSELSLVNAADDAAITLVAPAFVSATAPRGLHGRAA